MRVVNRCNTKCLPKTFKYL